MGYSDSATELSVFTGDRTVYSHSQKKTWKSRQEPPIQKTKKSNTGKSIEISEREREKGRERR